MQESTRASNVDPLAFIEHLEDDYRLRFGANPFNLSHWDPGPAYRREISRVLQFHGNPDAINYFFTYELEELKDALVRAFGFRNARVALLTNSGTNSTAAVVHRLSQSGVRHALIFTPCYFSVLRACEMFGITTHVIPFHRNGGSYQMPAPPEVGDDTVVWVTNPVFSTGCYVDVDWLPDLVRRGGSVVLDETLAVAQRSLTFHMPDDGRWFALHSPHKTLNVNGVKFSAVVGPRDADDSLEQWSDIISGGLAASTVMAIRHFLSPNFAACREILQSFTSAAFATLMDRSRELMFDVDQWTAGNFASVYLRDVPGWRGMDEPWLRRIMEASGVTVFPSVVSGADPSWGFGFRVNLTRYDASWIGALTRVIAAAADFSSSTP